jgi:hypothetical protein
MTLYSATLPPWQDREQAGVAVPLQTCIRELPGYNIARNSGCLDQDFLSLSQALRTNTGLVPRLRHDRFLPNASHFTNSHQLMSYSLRQRQHRKTKTIKSRHVKFSLSTNSYYEVNKNTEPDSKHPLQLKQTGTVLWEQKRSHVYSFTNIIIVLFSVMLLNIKKGFVTISD